MFYRFDDGARLSGASCMASAMDDEGTAWKHAALSSPQGPNLKRSHAGVDGSQRSSSLIPVGSSIMAHEAPDHGMGTEAATDSRLEMGGEARHPASEMLEVKGRDLL